MNLGPPSRWLEDNNSTEQAVDEVAVAGSSEESRDDMPQSDNDTVSETTSSHPPKTGKKSKSRAQVERELADKIINFASKEDHPVDLELAALCSKIKRKLPDPDDQDDLLDEIKDVARAFFQRKKRAANNISTVQPVRQTPPPPPPLQMFPQQQQQQEQGSRDMISQYSTVNYLTDDSSGATYMAL